VSPAQPSARAETPLATAKETPAQLSVDAGILLATPKITPTLIWPVDGHITQGYSDEHPALDIAAKQGTPVIAAAAGVVVVAARDEVYGYYIIIDHGNGLRTLYSKLLDYQVEIGDEVTQGQQIGRVGSTGNSTGPHLHFEVRQQINPLPLLRGK
jgi:murein DD-endopeptidase MepM/ murein hydrolase activator NlpD